MTYRRDSIPPSPCLARVAALPRRSPADEGIVRELSRYFATSPTARLKEAQATALVELAETGGLFAPMRVGSGKTLVTLLASELMGWQNPALLIPASLRKKTQSDFARYAQEWRVRLPALVSYEEMGRPDRETKLHDEKYDALILDEAHKARNLDAAVTRRIERCHVPRPALSATLMTPNLLDYHHHALWSLGDAAPVPKAQSEAELWSRAVDSDVSILDRADLGALASLPGGFFEWFRGSRGVVPTPGQDCDASILVEMWRPELPPKLVRLMEAVALTKLRPDGEPLDDWSVPDCICQLAQGFFYVWDPMPPDWWLRPRRGWWAYVRAVLEMRLPGLDSPSQVAMALDAGRPVPGDEEGRTLLAAWRAVEPRFEPNPVPVWIDVTPLVQAIKRAGKGCLIWTRHTAAGEMLQNMGVPWYPGGTNPETAKPGRTIALNLDAHGEGKNLQAWHRNLVLVPPAHPDIWEQAIGRTHRTGQKADTIFVDVYAASAYHNDVLKRVRSEAKRSSKASGFEHKLDLADWSE